MIVGDFEKKIVELESKIIILEEKNKKLSNALIKTQDVVSLVSAGAAAVARDVVGIIAVMEGKRLDADSIDAESAVSTWAPEIDEVN
jgi:hypothetical protein